MIINLMEDCKLDDPEFAMYDVMKTVEKNEHTTELTT